jgi:addiction module HigA family antidote
MMNERLPNPHPGETIREDVMEPLELTADDLARALHYDPDVLNEVIDGRAVITAELALRLSRFLGTTPQFWLNLQALYDLEEEELRLEPELAQIQTRHPVAAAA